ncbi:hypothetical protein Hanom_Chr05g00387501 [Helianthus anomalus]
MGMPIQLKVRAGRRLLSIIPKPKKRLSKLDKEFGSKTPALLEKILKHPMISIDELKALLTPAGPSSSKPLSGDESQCSYLELLGGPWLFVAFLRKLH